MVQILRFVLRLAELIQTKKGLAQDSALNEPTLSFFLAHEKEYVILRERFDPDRNGQATEACLPKCLRHAGRDLPLCFISACEKICAGRSDSSLRSE